MQLFQEYVVGKVSRSPHMFSVTSGDITFLKQFPADYWVDALWQRYNPILFGALKKREKHRWQIALLIFFRLNASSRNIIVETSIVILNSTLKLALS